MTGSSKASTQDHPDKAMAYAGFWERIAAFVIDTIIVGLVEGMAAVPVFLITKGQPLSSQHFQGFLELVALGFYLVIGLCTGTYFVFFETSKLQATPGKLALGLKVTDLGGQRMSFKAEIIKNLIQYVLYGLILVVSIGVELVTMHLGSRSKVLGQSSVWSVLAPLLSLLVGNLLYFLCFFLLVFSERKQTIFDKLTGRLVWSTRP
jgi:uncharacterized RDD family membrane protein YckC